jgi:tetratricopeptide (TPR) repeat protein
LPANAWHETAALVVGRLTRALHFELNDLATVAPTSVGSTEMQARALSAQAWVQLFARPQTRETNEQAVTLADRALTLAPRLAQAWMCQAFCDWRAATYGWGDAPIGEQWARALARVERAVELDPRDPDAHYVLGLVTMHHGQLLRAEEALRHCMRLAASFAPAHGLMGLVRLRRGFAAETAGHCDRAFALSPREPLRAIWHHAKAHARLDLGDVQGAFEEAQRGMAVNSNYPQNYVIGAAAAQRLGAHAQACEWVAVLRERTAFNSLAALRERTMRTYEPAAIGSLESVIALLREAGLPVE